MLLVWEYTFLMHRNNYFRAAFFTALLVLASHVVATVLYLYSYYWWFDIPLHWLGGLSAGFLSFAIMLPSGQSLSKVLKVSLAGAFLLGVSWELFEYCAGLTWNAIGNYPLDTLKDLAMDVVGGFNAFVIAWLSRCNNSKS